MCKKNLICTPNLKIQGMKNFCSEQLQPPGLFDLFFAGMIRSMVAAFKIQIIPLKALSGCTLLTFS